jgi:hypothetical protein
MLRTPILRRTVETCLAAEARLLPDVLRLPLGSKSAVAMRHLVSQGVLSANRVLEGMPRPSGVIASAGPPTTGTAPARPLIRYPTRPTGRRAVLP